MSDNKLIITIENKRPVELTAFVTSFQGIGLEYNRFINSHPDYKLTEETKLYITEVKSGSIIAYLSDLSPIVIPFVEHVNSVIEFTNFLKKGYDFLLGKSEEKPNAIGINDYRNMGAIIETVAKDNGSIINFTATDNANINISFSLNSIESNAIQNTIAKEILNAKLIETGANIFPKVAMIFTQVRNSPDAKKGTKGLIDSLNPKALNIIFSTNEIAESIIQVENVNPFTTVFVVDVSIETVNGIPVAYKIHRLYDMFPLE